MIEGVEPDRNMAAIIAQITREARARKIRKRYTLPINKSNYMIHPFKERFVPELDNPVNKSDIPELRFDFDPI